MKPIGEARSPTLENKAFLFLLLAVSLAFFWVLWPYFGAVFWGAIFALIFSGLHMRFRRSLPQKPTLAALATLGVILTLVILPLTVLTALLVQEVGTVYERVQSGELSFSRYFQQVFDALPAWVVGLMERFGLHNLGQVVQRVSAALTKGSEFFAGQALSLGQNAFDFLVSFFVMLYLLFFLLRDGAVLSRRIEEAIPLDADIKHKLGVKFATVIRATVRGNIAVAALQGFLGGLILWILGIHAPVLWGTLMAFLSLLPAVGAALVWLPVAIYFLATGSLVKGAVLIAFGVLVIGLVDNILRPVLVGKDTKMPDYVVLVSTLGGMALFGLNGFVIGPVVAAMFIAVWDIFASARRAALPPQADAPTVRPAELP